MVWLQMPPSGAKVASLLQVLTLHADWQLHEVAVEPSGQLAFTVWRSRYLLLLTTDDTTLPLQPQVAFAYTLLLPPLPTPTHLLLESI